MQSSDKPFQLAGARVCAILNKGSGRKNSDRIRAELMEKIAPVAAHFEIRHPPKGSAIGRTTAEAVAADFDVILAVGGDGTQAAVAHELVGTDKIMGVVPAGTFNYFSRELGCGENASQGIETLLNAHVVRIGVGQINGKVFLNNVSFGAYPDILEHRESIYRRWGRSRVMAYWSVISALSDMRHPMDLTAAVDGEERHYHTALAFVAKSAFQLESFGLAEGAEALRQGDLALFVARAKGPAGLIGAAMRLAFGINARDTDFDMITSKEIEIDTGRSLRLVAHDGEKTRMRGPFDLRVLPEALSVLVPMGESGREEAAES